MRLYSDRFGIIKVALPPLSEQEAIVRHLDVALADLSGSIDRANREISLLQEFRTRLIADVVTGKLDVRTAASTLPETVEEADTIDITDEVEPDDEAIEEREEAAA
jgi:type I restriction enzyme S subunit